MARTCAPSPRTKAVEPAKGSGPAKGPTPEPAPGPADSAWRWTLNWSELRGDIVVGSCPMAPDDIDRIVAATGITAIQSLQSGACRAAFSIDYGAHEAHGEDVGLTMVNTPMLDFDPPDQRRNLPAAIRALTALLAAGRKVYVHCTAGCNRSPLVVLGYLTFVEMVPPADAIAFIRRSRPEAEPSWEAFDGARVDLVEAMQPFINVRAYYLHEQHPERASSENWRQAETDVIRQAFASPRSLPMSRLDPART